MDDPHYACGPLASWLPTLAGQGARAVAPSGVLPRRLGTLLADWDVVGTTTAGLGLLVVVGEPTEADAVALARTVQPGGWLVELRPLPRSLARTLLALRESPRQAVELGCQSIELWSRLGFFDLQQSTSNDPPDLLVTCARRR